ncbi:hypothetical protein NQ318_014617 [Aromia moschata]|uniref:Uncharacterized protein n=1 Tax=Aromia moschata TaxID=1265417 RepID=A0AAV8ZCT5_9CUCU|nr:hypothetical protein NQ318_014617 [Aromia moschata]
MNIVTKMFSISKLIVIMPLHGLALDYLQYTENSGRRGCHIKTSLSAAGMAECFPAFTLRSVILKSGILRIHPLSNLDFEREPDDFKIIYKYVLTMYRNVISMIPISFNVSRV